MHRPRTTRPAGGFTLIELVMVMVVIGSLAVFAVPRMLDLDAWRVRAFADELRAQSMAMQRLALAQRRPVVATITGGGVGFAYEGGDSLVTLECPPSLSPCITEGGTRSATFNAANSGSTTTSTGEGLPLTVSGGGVTLAYRLETETGLFRPLP